MKNYGILSTLPPATKHLLIINILCWFAIITFSHTNINLINEGGLHFILADKFNPTQFITYMFLHDSRTLTHLLFNMFALFMFGRVLENTWGTKRFLTYYIITGLGAAIVQQVIWYIQLQDLLASPAQTVNMMGTLIDKATYLNMHITIGASGAIFGILLAFGVTFPNSQLYLFFIPYPIKAKYFITVYAIIELSIGIYNPSSGIAHFAHLGGMLFGLIIILIWKNNAKKQR